MENTEKKKASEKSYVRSVSVSLPLSLITNYPFEQQFLQN